MYRRIIIAGMMALAIGVALAQDRADFEVWVTDQSGTAGRLFIYDGETLIDEGARATPEIVDLGGAVAALCQQQTGSPPVRAHMMDVNRAGTHVILAYVASGHVVFIDARRRTPVACLDVGAQAHAAMASPDGRYVIVANQNGKMLLRIATDYATNTFTLDSAATLNLATCTTPGGARCEDDGQTQTNVRPDNAPICPIVEAGSRLVFVTLRGGGLFVVDGTATPLRIVAEYGLGTVRGNGCGGMQAAGRMFINAGGGTAGRPTESTLYSFNVTAFQPTNPPDSPRPRTIFSQQAANDGHGMLATRDGRFIWVADRMANMVEVVEAETDTRTNTFPLAGAVSADPAPDLMVLSPGGGYAFATLRGPCPLTANTGANNAVGATPGVAIISVDDIGLRGTLRAVAPIASLAPAGFDCPTRTDDAPGSITNQADVHGIALRLK
jgi:DNA-binding beta-propeller fold protein YncE